MSRNLSLSSTAGLLGSLTLLGAVLAIAHPASASDFNQAAIQPKELTPILSKFNTSDTKKSQANNDNVAKASEDKTNEDQKDYNDSVSTKESQASDDNKVKESEDKTKEGQKDFNDSVLEVKNGEKNDEKSDSYSAAAPEPTQWAGIGLAILLGWRLQRLLKSQSLNESLNDSEEISKA